MVLDDAPLDRMPRRAHHALLTNLRRALKIPFVAVHAASLAAALGDEEYLGEMPSFMHSADADADALIVTAFKALSAGDWQTCVSALERDRPTAWEAIGGSNEERALLGKLYSTASARVRGIAVRR